MTAITPDDLTDWRCRLADALKDAFNAMAADVPVGEIARLDRAIRAIKDEGRAKGFMPAEGARR